MRLIPLWSLECRHTGCMATQQKYIILSLLEYLVQSNTFFCFSWNTKWQNCTCCFISKTVLKSDNCTFQIQSETSCTACADICTLMPCWMWSNTVLKKGYVVVVLLILKWYAFFSHTFCVFVCVLFAHYKWGYRNNNIQNICQIIICA